MKYFAVLTDIGQALLANAIVLNSKLPLSSMGVGDANGSLPTPLSSQTKLINERHRNQLNSLVINPENKNQIIAELVLPENLGGWWIREIGLYDSDGNLIAVGNCPETYKPQLVEGSGRTQVIRIVLIVSNTDAIELKIDPSVVLATREFVSKEITTRINQHEKSINHPEATTTQKGFVQLSSAFDSDSEKIAATSKAVKLAYDLAASKLTSAPVNSVNNKTGAVHLNAIDVSSLTVGTDGNIQLETQNVDTISFPTSIFLSYEQVTPGTLPFHACHIMNTRESNGFTSQLAINTNGAGIAVRKGDAGQLDASWDYYFNELVGIPQPWPCSIPPLGWLKCDGSSFDKNRYPLLAQAYPSGVLPDLRGEFIRGWDDSRGIDNKRIILTHQNDAFQGHHHETDCYNTWGGKGVRAAYDWAHSAYGKVTDPISDGKNGDARVAHETRPRNIAFLYIVRAA